MELKRTSPVLLLQQLLAVIGKELRSEFRQRVSVAVTLLAVGVIVLTLALAVGETVLSSELAAALLWLVFFFGLSPALGRSFVAEEERGTRLLLHLLAPPAVVYWGKLVTNCMVGVVTNVLSCAAFFVFLRVSVPALLPLLVVVGVAAIGFAAVLTLLSAIIAVAHHRGVLLPIAGLPMVVPLMVPGIEAVRLLLQGGDWSTVAAQVMLIVAYSGSVAVLGFWLFEWVWQE